ncbi:hypothetical protein GCM10010329_58710 [Streptomyces spiroverticillatus]|uniref:Uncharacterized protein n=1 Tax=Streptomyces finlayi TaxID=67296 RepID=A0A918X3P8_9ACTN|nr:DUF6397 family protein [Streptomyces finlayi]GHA27687.1 hypothetical protein GCM10010329_58710 [Streptomyces spiroverticillatus]GHD08748.1 hypothetical protein GCM10010334_62370 [Streptomyces finlayi]
MVVQNAVAQNTVVRNAAVPTASEQLWGARDVNRAVHETVTAVRAAQELGLKKHEFDLAVQLGRIRTVADLDGGRRRVAREEVDRLLELDLRATPLRERLRTAGTSEGATLLNIGRARFTGLARAGYLQPVRFYLNRYRAVVWLYLVEELADFAARHPELLRGHYPDTMRAALAAGEDRRPRNWRSRRLGQLLARTEDPWEQAAIFSSLLAPDRVARVVDAPHEADRLAALRAGLVAAEPRSPAAREAVRTLLVADDPDEIDWIVLNLAISLNEARSKDTGSAPQRPACEGPTARRPARHTGLRLLRGLERMPSWRPWRALPRRWSRGSRKPQAHEAH